MMNATAINAPPSTANRPERVFFLFGFLPQAVVVVSTLVLTLGDRLRIWPPENDSDLKSYIFGGLLAVAVLIIIASQIPGTFKRWRSVVLYIAGLIQLGVLFFVVNLTGGLNGSPYSFYYYYIPAIVGIAFINPATSFSTSSSKWIRLRQVLLMPGLRAAIYTAVLCGLCVYFHVYMKHSEWSPAATISSEQLQSLMGILDSPDPLLDTEITAMGEICRSGFYLSAANLADYKIIRLLTLVFPIFAGLITHAVLERQSVRSPKPGADA